MTELRARVWAAGREIPLPVVTPPGPHTLGRGASAHLHVGDRRVSREHARLELREGIWWYVDQSTNGSYDDAGQPVSELPVTQPRRVRLGDAVEGPVLSLEPLSASGPGELPGSELPGTASAGSPPGTGAPPGTVPVTHDSAAGIHQATYSLGVDLGTTYTAAAVVRGGRAEAVSLSGSSVAVPSVLYFGSGDLVVGDAAQRRAATEPTAVVREFKRRVGDPTPVIVGVSPVAAELLMARLLGWVVAQVTQTEGAPPAALAVTHPANWGSYKLDLLSQACRHLGIAVDLLVPEPVAAAAFYASHRALPEGAVVAVYDLGGGTFDAAIVRSSRSGFEIIGRPQGIERLGGIDFDHAVLRHVAGVAGLDLDQADPSDDGGLMAAMTQLRRECVAAKEALSIDSDVTIPASLPGGYREVRLTRSEFEEMIGPPLGETVVALERAMESAAVTPAEVQDVLLVGGSSRIPLVAQVVTAQTGCSTAVDARPKDAICMGAALVAA